MSAGFGVSWLMVGGLVVLAVAAIVVFAMMFMGKKDE